MISSRTLCLVGAGNMGGAMLAGWLAAGHKGAQISVIDPGPPPAMAELMAQHGVQHFPDASKAVRADILIIALKPQLMGAVLPGLTHLMDENNVLVSVAAGTTIESLSAPFTLEGKAIRIIRAMPNTPAMVQRGISVCVANDGVSEEQKETVSHLLMAVGDVDWVQDEALIDAVTGVSGSGPAYVFLLAEELAKAGVAAGLPAPLAARLAQATVSGAGELMRQSELPPAKLRENVTSPNGTTAAALAVLMDEQGLSPLMEKAVAAATERSRELAKG